jgi:predicted nucleic acid-binding Zn ribbon protein
MATWDFKCITCDKVTEHNIKDGEEFPKCEACNITLTKLFVAAPIHFKGGGWAGGSNVG